MADFIEEEETLYLIPSVSPTPITPIPSQPFRLLKLPREIRDSIYYYALLRPRNGPSVHPTHICYLHPKGSADSSSSSYQSPYWGTRESTRLFLVNRQTSREALRVFYSTYPFHFSQSVDIALVHATFRDTLSPWARSLITRIGFMFGVILASSPFTKHETEQARQAIEAAMGLLPNVKRVVLTLTLAGFDVPEYQEKEIVARVLDWASPLKGFPGLSLKGDDYATDQRTRIMGE
ncbi:MAG: hypothetical protein Q9201_003994, partial [Fulgogasparrea decipioides]